ncbi:MAG: glycosyltransferase [Proteobacteria bacterium]|nr:glycosyltransferase [Pseudomonadota bacterium]
MYAETVCRRTPRSDIAALLRAKVLEACSPSRAAVAWYAAWRAAPANPLLQDGLLQAWVAAGKRDAAARLGPVFLPERCRSGTHAGLLTLLRAAGLATFGACWKQGEDIEGMVFAEAGAGPTRRLLVSDGTRQQVFDVPANGQRFRIPWRAAAGVWSLALAPDAAGDSVTAGQILQGSPLSFVPAPVTVEAGASKPATGAIKAQGHAALGIVIPVYGQLELVSRCIDSVLASLPHNRCSAEVIVVDDASPDPALRKWLDRKAVSGRIRLLRNPFNLGFIGACNRGIAAVPGDVLLLNADALVHGDWLDRLSAVLNSADDIASVTPWSNNGEISSLPDIGAAAPALDAAQLARVDGIVAAVREAGLTTEHELPTCCGFAMLMRRQVVDEIGGLDDVDLLRGYNEEVDWCLRARRAGYRHLLASGVFVAHSGTASFGDEKVLRVVQNKAVLAARYPDHEMEYARFLRDDPLDAMRKVILERLRQAGADWYADRDEDASLPDALGEPEKSDVSESAPPSAACWIAVRLEPDDAVGYSKTLQLARLIASRPAEGGTPFALLCLGLGTEALWRSRVVNVLPPEPDAPQCVIPDSLLSTLLRCTTVLASPSSPVRGWEEIVRLDERFDPAAWLAARHSGASLSPA